MDRGNYPGNLAYENENDRECVIGLRFTAFDTWVYGVLVNQSDRDARVQLRGALPAGVKGQSQTLAEMTIISTGVIRYGPVRMTDATGSIVTVTWDTELRQVPRRMTVRLHCCLPVAYRLDGTLDWMRATTEDLSLHGAGLDLLSSSPMAEDIHIELVIWLLPDKAPAWQQAASIADSGLDPDRYDERVAVRMKGRLLRQRQSGDGTYHSGVAFDAGSSHAQQRLSDFLLTLKR